MKTKRLVLMLLFALLDYAATAETQAVAGAGRSIVTTERGLGLRALAVYGLLTLMLSLFLVPLACIVHYYFRKEILSYSVATGSGERHSDGKSAGRKAEEKAVVTPVGTEKRSAVATGESKIR